MTETTNQPTIREQAIAALDEAEKALTWTTNRGQWEPVRDYATGRRGLVKHQPTGDDLAEFVHPADAEHAAMWHPSRVQALINRDRAILAAHSPNPLSDDACPCGWEWDHCPTANAVITFWLAEDHPAIHQTRGDVATIEAVRGMFNQMVNGGDWDGQVSSGFSATFDQHLDAILEEATSNETPANVGSTPSRSNEPGPHDPTGLLATDVGVFVRCACGWNPTPKYWIENHWTGDRAEGERLVRAMLPQDDDDACRGEGRGTGR